MRIGAPDALRDKDPATAGHRPSHGRYKVLAMLFLLSIITYLDRVCIAAAAPLMTAELGMTPLQMGMVFSAFFWAYGIFEIPSGWMGDRYGPRKTLTRIVLWWSFFTALTGRVNGFYALWATRFLFGAGEAGAYPNSSCAVSRWFPFIERARAHGVIWMASRIGGALAPLIVVPLQARFGWRAVFYMFGALGVVWAVIWYFWYRDYPEQKSGVNSAEVRIIREGAPAPAAHGSTPWGVLLSSANLWAVTAMYFTYGYGVQFYFSWLPTYLVKELGITNFAAYASLPFFLGAIANALGGWSSDALVRRLGLKWGRRSVGLIGLGGSIVLRPAFHRLYRPARGGGRAGTGFRLHRFHAAQLLGGLPGYRKEVFRHGDRFHEYRGPDRGRHSGYGFRLFCRPRAVEYRNPDHGGNAVDQFPSLAEDRREPATASG